MLNTIHTERDITWLSFNERVLQEAQDETNNVYNRIRFLGIFSNNLDEYYRVRVAALNKTQTLLTKKNKLYIYNAKVLKKIHAIIAKQSSEFEKNLHTILQDLAKQKIIIKTNTQLNDAQQKFVHHYFENEVRNYIVPLMIQSIGSAPVLKDKNLYLACSLSNNDLAKNPIYTLIEIPSDQLGRFIQLPDEKGFKNLILLEDIVRECLPLLFAQFGYTHYNSSIIQVTRDAELNIDNEINTHILNKVQKGLQNRKRGKATRFVFEKNINAKLLNYLINLLNITQKDSLLEGGKFHNCKDFMNFPSRLFNQSLIAKNRETFVHPLLVQPKRILKVLDKQDVMLHFPYHSFDSIIDLLREASIDAKVQSIKITCYRLAKNSKIINALINAARNGKQVVVVLELRARFDESANIFWKQQLQQEGVKVIFGKPELIIHAKLCLITKLDVGKIKQYGFISTGNLNESTAKLYGDHCLLTAEKSITNGIQNTFRFLEGNTKSVLRKTEPIVVSPTNTRNHFIDLINNEIKHAKKGIPAKIIVKLNSLSDSKCIVALINAANNGVEVNLIIRGIFCLDVSAIKKKNNFKAISIVDSYLEHARVLCFANGGKQLVYIGSADWMPRNLDHRVEACVAIKDEKLIQELMNILQLQLAENVKARQLNNKISSNYVIAKPKELRVRSQEKIGQYLKHIIYKQK